MSACRSCAHQWGALGWARAALRASARRAALTDSPRDVAAVAKAKADLAETIRAADFHFNGCTH